MSKFILAFCSFDKILFDVIICSLFWKGDIMITENAKIRWINYFNNGVSLSFAPASIQDNKELVMIAVGLNGENLKFASERLKNDMDVVLLAINQDVEYLKYADKGLQSLIILKGIEAIKEDELPDLTPLLEAIVRGEFTSFENEEDVDRKNLRK